MSQPETFAEAMARIKREVAMQPEADRLGYIKASVNGLVSMSEADRSALFDLLMEIPSQISAGPVTLLQNINQNANPIISQTASPQVTQTQNANPHLEVSAPAAPSSGSSSIGNIVAVVVAIITIAGGIAVALINARAAKKDDAAAATRSATDTSRKAIPPVAPQKGTKQAGSPSKP